MREYHGISAKKFTQTRGKTYLLNPAVKRHLSKASKKNENLLDVGCGNSFFYDLANKKGYEYYGLDSSPEMIERSKIEHPRGHYTVSQATNFSKKYPLKFEVVLMVQLFPAFNNKKDMVSTLQEAKKVLNPGGIVIIGFSHPNFDRYMEKGLFGNSTVDTKFNGYFQSGVKMLISHNFNGEEYVFEDYHWLLEDYAKCIHEAGLVILEMDECKPDISAKKIDRAFYEGRSQYPTYMLFVCK